MCGIVGYIGKKHNAIEVLLSGLKNLEYRGYDSAGIAYVENKVQKIIKASGQIINLENKLDKKAYSSVGIGHTRWATHGKPTEINAHPHRVGNITIVHNGIIENYLELKKKLEKEGYSFVSETDTEIACALIDSIYKKNKDMLSTLKEFQKNVKGSYAIAAIVDNEPDFLYIIKNMSPLIIGIGEDETFIASDVPAILEYTNKYIVLKDHEYAKLHYNDIKLFDECNRERKFEIKTFSEDASSIGKNGYEHFMLKEIHEEPEITKRLIQKYSDKQNLEILPNISDYENIMIVACGSAMHAGLIGKYILENTLNIPVSVEIASEFRYKKLFLNEKSLIIAISQSGETADTLAAVKIAKSMQAHTIGIVNVKESSIAREVDEVIYTEAGSEIAVATTKAYLAQCVILTMLALKNTILDFSILSSLPAQMETLINNNEEYDKIAKRIKNENDIYFIGRQIDYAICMEGSLKLKEISYLHSEAYAAGELKHGSIALINDDTPVFAVISDNNIAEKTISNIKEVKARGAYVILIINETLDFEGDCYDKKIIIPNVHDKFNSILSIIPLQLIAYKVALLRGCSIDKPKNLAKSVTVE